jgi:hypothetical protein
LSPAAAGDTVRHRPLEKRFPSNCRSALARHDVPYDGDIGSLRKDHKMKYMMFVVSDQTPDQPTDR